MSTVEADDRRTPSTSPGRKPSYLGLLNEIAEAERRGFRSFTAWADRCLDADLEPVLRLVAAREGEHAATFSRRVVELGFRVRPRPDTEEEARRIEAAGSGLDDLSTFDALGYSKRESGGAPDVFDGFFKDRTIDPATGALLGRFIAEERDSGRILRAAREELLGRERGER